MPILPLPQFEADLKAHLDERDKAAYEALQVPKTIVVRYGSMKMIGEFPYAGTEKPGCGSKIVVRTFRGTEVGEMLTSTCPNTGCSKAVSRQDMLKYIENSGGRDYPFSMDGKALRVATKDDLDKQAQIEQSKHAFRLDAKAIAEQLRLPIKLVEVEPVLGGESISIYYTTASEERVEVRDLAREATKHFRVRCDVKHVGARDEARLSADYERCGQYCCCKNFLKVLRPVSMKSAKIQKATLDPLKISGRCGRLMCCLRYEDSTYEDLRKRLPKRKTRVGTPEGDGLVLDGQILTQLVLVELDALGSDGKIQQVAVPVENLSEPVSKVPPVRPRFDGPMGGPGGGPGGPPGMNRGSGGPPRPMQAGPQSGSQPGHQSGTHSAPGQASAGPGQGLNAPSQGPRPDGRNDRPPRAPYPPSPQGGRPPSGPRPQGPNPGNRSSGPGGPPPPQSRGPQSGSQPGPQSGPQSGQRGGPSQGQPPQNSPPRPPRNEVDDLLDEIETDFGHHGGPSQSGPGGPPRDDRGGRRRRRGRGGRGGGPGGGGDRGGGERGGGPQNRQGPGGPPAPNSGGPASQG